MNPDHFVIFGLKNNSEFQLYLMNPGDQIFFHFGHSVSEDMSTFTKLEHTPKLTSIEVAIEIAYYEDETTENGCDPKIDLKANQGDFVNIFLDIFFFITIFSTRVKRLHYPVPKPSELKVFDTLVMVDVWSTFKA